jgi:hypothetical protein
MNPRPSKRPAPRKHRHAAARTVKLVRTAARRLQAPPVKLLPRKKEPPPGKTTWGYLQEVEQEAQELE